MGNNYTNPIIVEHLFIFPDNFEHLNRVAVVREMGGTVTYKRNFLFSNISYRCVMFVVLIHEIVNETVYHTIPLHLILFRVYG